MTYQPLTHREWLERIVDTGAQRSGFAADTLRALDEAEGRAEILGQLIDEVWRRGVEPEADPVRIIGEQVAGFQGVISLLVDAGVLDGDADVTPDQVLGVLRMFVPS